MQKEAGDVHAILEDAFPGSKKPSSHLVACLKEAYTNSVQCIVCWNAPREVLFLPCKHFVACKDCSKRFRHPIRCCKCRAYVTRTKDVFL